ncbi:MAG: hypothetical protein SGJ09_06695 [Phycisphaerae bacterium]|nr:hypothetical protein [Phycisphaerae bacterium]
MLRILPRVSTRPRTSPFLAFSIALSASMSSSLCATVWAGDFLTIRTLAPEKSVLVIGVDDIDATWSRYERTPLAAYWNSADVQKSVKDFRAEIEKSINEATADIGVAREDVTLPSSLGAAVFLQLDEATGTEEPVFIAFVDWGKEAESFGKLYDAAIAKVEKDKPMPFTVEEMKGRRVYVFEQPKPVDGAANDVFDGPFGAMKLCVTRDGARLLVTAGASAMSDVLAKLDGDKGKTVSDNPDFKGTLDTVGGEPDLYAALLTEKAFALISSIEPAAAFMLGAGMGVLPSAIGDIRGWSLGITLDRPLAPLVQSIGAYIPNGKVGLLSLLTSSPVEKAPALVPSDSVSYGRLNIKFNELPRVIEDLVAKLPEAFADQAAQTIEPYMPKLKASLGAMNSTMQLWSGTGTKEGGPAAPVVAVGVTDSKQAQSIVEMLGDSVSIKPRDFLGHTIFSGEDAGMPAIGFSSQYMFVSTAIEVEKSLRALGAKDESSLTSDPVYQAATAAWSKEDLVGYGYTDTIALLESLELMSDGLGGASAMAGKATGVDLDQLGGDAAASILKPELLKNFFGPTVWQIRSTKSGLRTDFMVLPATNAAPASGKK